MDDQQNEILGRLNVLSDRLDSFDKRITLLEGRSTVNNSNTNLKQNIYRTNFEDKNENIKTKKVGILDKEVTPGGCILFLAFLFLMPISLFLGSEFFLLLMIAVIGYIIVKNFDKTDNSPNPDRFNAENISAIPGERSLDQGLILENNIQGSHSDENLEMKLGQHFFSKLGIVALVIGIALFLIYSLQYFDAVGKVLLGYMSSLVLIAFGYFLEKKYTRYGQLLLGGGVAVAYFTTYAAYFFPTTKIIQNQEIVLGILTMISLFYLLYMLRYRSEVMAGIALVLVFLTANLGDIKTFSLIMLNIFLLVAVVISSVKKWKISLFMSLFLSYATIFRWIMDSSGFPIPREQFVFIISIVTISYALFSLGTYFVYRKGDVVEGTNRELDTEVIAYTIINSVIYYWFLSAIFNANYTDVDETLLMAYSILNLVLASLIQFFSSVKSFVKAYLGIATVSIFIYIFLEFTGISLVLWWLVLGLSYMIYGIVFGTIRTRIVGTLIIIASFITLIFSFENIEMTILRLMLFIFAILFEILSLSFLNIKLKSKLGDLDLYDKYLQNIFASSSVASLALVPWFLESHKYLTLHWGGIAFIVAILGFALNDKIFRRTGLILLLITVLRLFVVDLSSMDPIIKIISFIVLGLILLAISFGYTKYKDEIGRYL